MAKNRGESIRTKLANAARAKGQDTQALGRRFVGERLLARLVESQYGNHVVLVGNHLFWADKGMSPWARPTIDLDIHDYGTSQEARPDAEDVVAAISEAMSQDLHDGIDYVITGMQNLEQAGENGGVRIYFDGLIHTMSCKSYVDISFGGQAPPSCRAIEYPSTLPKDFPPTRVPMMPFPHVVAEKVCAMIQHGIDNTRTKDFYDLLMLKRHGKLDSNDVVMALIHESREHAKPMPKDGLPACLTDAYAQANQKAWSKERSRLKLEPRCPENYADAIQEIRDWLQPLISRAARSMPSWRADAATEGTQAPGM